MDIFASSGGAVNAPALVAKHPEQVRTLVAHEPPVSRELPDREAILAACTDIRQTYLDSGFGPAMAKFIVLVSYQGELTADYAEQPAPDPAVFGLPAEDDGSRNDPLVGRTSSPATPTSTTSTRSAPPRPASSSVSARSPAPTSRAARRWPWPDGSASRRSPSPAATTASWAASTARPASRTRSRPRSVRSWPADHPRAGYRPRSAVGAEGLG
ncbi:MAG TPA: hypothetical protein VKU77_11115 [Streptosporangiaceae bacterium]|nr:hypothetical protein [Streptosporangiaceae bacterium]